MTTLSKSKLLLFLNCPKSLWLEIHWHDLRHDSDATETKFEVGNTVGEIAQRLYDPKGKGIVFNAQENGYTETYAQSMAAIDGTRPLFEAGFTAAGAKAFADVMLPAKKGGKRVWRMVEVKSSGKVKDYHRNDAAIQAFVARQAGVSLASIALAHVDTKWVYPGGGDYAGLLKEVDLTDEAFGRAEEVEGWIAEAQKLLKKRKPPETRMGRHCSKPWECGFYEFCAEQAPQTDYPVAWLPDVRAKALTEFLTRSDSIDMRQVPDTLLNDTQLRVKKHTLTNKVYFNRKGASAALAGFSLPAYFLDFETILYAVPIWKGTRPYQQIPFQFSLHRMARDGALTHKSFLDLSGNDPSKALAESLVAECGKQGPIFAYGADFEKRCIKGLAERLPRMKNELLALEARIIDLLPIAESYYYHPTQQGSWSLKNVLPTITPKLDYSGLEGVQNGGMAMEAYREAIAPKTTKTGKAKIEQQLLEYCKLDTLALVEVWNKFV